MKLFALYLLESEPDWDMWSWIEVPVLVGVFSSEAKAYREMRRLIKEEMPFHGTDEGLNGWWAGRSVKKSDFVVRRIKLDDRSWPTEPRYREGKY